MHTLTKRTVLNSQCLAQTVLIRQFSNTSKIITPRRNVSIEYDHKNNTTETKYASKTSSRSINIYDKVSEDSHDINLSKKMKKKLNKQSKLDISANFSQKNKKTKNDNNIHGIMEMFEQQPMINDNEHWYNNPQHIDEVEQFLKQNKLPFEQQNEWKTEYITDDIIVRDKLRVSNPKISKRMQLKLNRKIKTKQRGNDEDMTKKELIKRNVTNTNNKKIIINNIENDENKDISLKVWDSIKKEFSHSPTPIPPAAKQKKKKKLANKWGKYVTNDINITDLRIANVSPYWLTYKNIDPVILDQLSRVLPTSSRHYGRTPQGLYALNDETKKTLQKLLVSEYWPSGWAEKQEQQIFAQRLFNAVSVKYDRRKVLRYIANEFPLSLSVNYRILKELKHRMPDFNPKGMLDFGQGPGCGTLAAIEVFDSLKNIYAIEPSHIMREFGTKILENYTSKYHMSYLDNLHHKTSQQPLIICSFTLSEISGGIDKVCEYLDNLWLSTRKILIFIESGTIDGYNLINFARSYLLSKYPPSNDVNIPGTYTIAPCPHDKQCPLSSDHICRFVQRIDRHQVPTRCMFKSDKSRSKYIHNKNTIREKRMGRRKVKLRDKRKINEIQFPYSYCILGKGVSPRLISSESNIFSQHFPHYFMNNKQAEQAAYFWPRIISPPKYRHNNLYLHLCLPDIPSHAQQTTTTASTENKALIRSDATTELVPNGRVCGRLKLDKRRSAKHHINIVDEEGIDEKEYGYLEKWLIAKSDNKLQMYQDARRSKWADLWPWPSPSITRCPSAKKLNPETKHSYKALTRYSRPRFRDYFAKFRKDCQRFVRHPNHIDLISHNMHQLNECEETFSLNKVDEDEVAN